MRDPIQARLFLVGCPRTGTTLIQSLLAAHSQIASFPESHLLLAGGGTRWGQTIWLEKTPLHLLYIKQFEQFIPGVKFIHLLRNGADVVASLVG